MHFIFSLYVCDFSATDKFSSYLFISNDTVLQMTNNYWHKLTVVQNNFEKKMQTKIL